MTVVRCKLIGICLSKRAYMKEKKIPFSEQI